MYIFIYFFTIHMPYNTARLRTGVLDIGARARRYSVFRFGLSHAWQFFLCRNIGNERRKKMERTINGRPLREVFEKLRKDIPGVIRYTDRTEYPYLEVKDRKSVV